MSDTATDWPDTIPQADAHAGTAEAVAARPYMNPYFAGVGLGLVLLAAFVVMGRGLGASGAFAALVATILHAVAPEHVMGNGYLAGYIGDGTSHPLKTWLVFEVIGVFVGALLSGLLARRVGLVTERGPRASVAARLGMALLGGGLMGFGAALARGCTSGQALTGGALLNLGSWAFMLMVFAGAYALAYVVRWQWK